MEDRIYLALLHTIGFNQTKLRTIFTEHQNYQEVYENISHATLEAYGFTKKQIDFILQEKLRRNINNINTKISERNVKIITLHDEEYPKELLNIPHVPYVIYMRGSMGEQNKLSFVGSRQITEYGKKVTSKLLGDVGRYFPIVSGGAAGCDTQAHKVCLEYGISTIAVIGTGIDVDYPVPNKKMYDEIAEGNGAVISIFPVGEVGNPYNFPMRNEIVAGLSLGTVVVEAKKKSGSLITANLALDLGKDVFAIPGDITKTSSEGCNELIKQGAAKLTLGPLDILEEYNIRGMKKTENTSQIPLTFNNNTEKEIYNILLIESLDLNKIAKRLGCKISEVSFHISMMEITGVIKKTLGGKYEIN